MTAIAYPLASLSKSSELKCEELSSSHLIGNIFFLSGNYLAHTQAKRHQSNLVRISFNLFAYSSA